MRSLLDDRLQSVRKRIAIIRQALEDPTTVSNFSIDGLDEKFNRADLRNELKDLESQELALLRQIQGSPARIHGISLK